MITMDDTPLDAAIKLSAGNPGAAVACAALLAEPDGFIFLCHMDDLHLSGSTIHIAYKYFAGRDIAVLRDALVNRRDELLDYIHSGRWKGTRT